MCTAAQTTARMMPLTPSSLPCPSGAPASPWLTEGVGTLWSQGQIQHHHEPRMSFILLKGCKKKKEKKEKEYATETEVTHKKPNLFTMRPLQSAYTCEVLPHLLTLISPNSWLLPPATLAFSVFLKHATTPPGLLQSLLILPAPHLLEEAPGTPFKIQPCPTHTHTPSFPSGL